MIVFIKTSMAANAAVLLCQIGMLRHILDGIGFNDEDIKSLHKTIEYILEILKKYTDSDTIESIEQIRLI